jgi:hypothetical protein
MESLPKTSSTTSGSQHGRYRLAVWTLAFALICGGILRQTWIEDMEWKPDERWSYQMSQEVGRMRPWPWVGMPTSLGFQNPGLSVWTFVAIGRMATTPTSMARAVALLNIVGLLGFAAAVRAYLPVREREPWIWGLALQAVSPFAIRLSRKIWPPSTLTPFLLLLWISHQHRQVRWGAFAWGLVGALIGQVHLSAWFVAVGLVVGTVVAECRGRLPRSRYWQWWLFGTLLGLTIALPWARAGPVVKMVSGRVVGYLYGLASSASSAFPYQALGLLLPLLFCILPLLVRPGRAVHAAVATRAVGHGGRPGPGELCIPQLRPSQGRDQPRGVRFDLRPSREPLKPADLGLPLSLVERNRTMNGIDRH